MQCNIDIGLFLLFFFKFKYMYCEMAADEFGVFNPYIIEFYHFMHFIYIIFTENKFLNEIFLIIEKLPTFIAPIFK